MINVATGGFWPRQRVNDATRHRLSPDCPRCKEQPETPLHRFWLCRCNSAEHKAFKQSEDLVPRAVSCGESEACFWFRGLIPRAWTAVPSA
eukprot:1362297-Pyramimonas_sp.AAC.1